MWMFRCDAVQGAAPVQGAASPPVIAAVCTQEQRLLLQLGIKSGLGEVLRCHHRLQRVGGMMRHSLAD